MDPLWKKILVVALWVAFTVWFIQPVPGKGLPLGRRYFRFSRDLAWRSLSLPGNPDEGTARQRRGGRSDRPAPQASLARSFLRLRSSSCRSRIRAVRRAEGKPPCKKEGGEFFSPQV